MRAPRLVIADDHPLVLQALRRLVEPIARVVDAASDGEELVHKVIAQRPDAVILDVCMPGLDGLAAAARIRAAAPAMPIAFWTMTEPPPAAELDALSPVVWLSKNLPAAELAVAFARWLTPEAGPAHEGPTPRQLEVLRLLAQGQAMKQVAARLGVSVRTIAFHKYRAMKLLGLQSTADVVRYVLEEATPGSTPAPPVGGADARVAETSG
jgi:DNA-binding NarL/FixJ family response regulator